MGTGSFIPPGMIQTAAQNAAAGRRRAGAPRRRRAMKRAARAPRTRRRKPRPGTKAWMAYIRSKRKK